MVGNTITKICKFCDKEFEASTSEHNRGYALFCSRSCSSKHTAANRPKPKPNCKCAQCEIKFYRNSTKQKLSRSGLQFCSRKCKDTAQRIGGITEIQPPHYGTSSSNTYRAVAFREFSNKCIRCGYDLHKSALVVHHKDSNRDNNDLSNLEILCANCHAIEHWS